MPEETAELPPLDARFEQVLTEILQAEEQGRTPDLQAYLERYPDLEVPLREFFRNRAGFARLAPLVTATPAAAESGTLAKADTLNGPKGPPTRPALVLTPGSRFGGYEILEEFGRGGMGIVYRARQLVPEREVALKVIRLDRLEDLSDEERRQWIERFHREAQLVATLDQHPHIVNLYEVGEHQGQPYFTMRLLTGGSLAQRLEAPKDSNPAAAADRRVREQRASAELLAKVARAVDYAHRRGILHRDLKPANILLDAEGEPLVSDFGLARRLDQTGSLVASGIVGTAPYMPPEQAAASPGAATTAADVYSLGAILYELLTGRPPFRGPTDLDTLLLVLQRAPVPARQVNPHLSRDLETICLKCLEKETARRYQTAAGLADDLGRFLTGEPIAARPVGRFERAVKWTRRNPLVAALLAAITVSLLAGTAVATFFAIRANEKAAEAEKENSRANEKAAEFEKEKSRVEYALWISRASRAWQQNRERGITSLAISGDGRRIISGSDAGPVKVWDAGTGKELLTLEGAGPVAISGDGRRIVSRARGEDALKVWDAGTGKELLTLEGGGPVAISGDGRRIVSRARGEDKHDVATLKVWDADTGKELRTLEGHTSRRWVAISSDGGWVVSPGRDGIRLWDVATGKGKFIGRGHDCLAISGDGRCILSQFGNPLKVLDAATGQELRTIKKIFFRPGYFNRIGAISNDGRWIVSASTTGGQQTAEVTVWDAATGQKHLTIEAHTTIGDDRPRVCVAISSDGRWIVSAGLRDMRLWDAATGQQ
jgi:serine/threonine protein kinase